MCVYAAWRWSISSHPYRSSVDNKSISIMDCTGEPAYESTRKRRFMTCRHGVIHGLSKWLPKQQGHHEVRLALRWEAPQTERKFFVSYVRLVHVSPIFATVSDGCFAKGQALSSTFTTICPTARRRYGLYGYGMQDFEQSIDTFSYRYIFYPSGKHCCGCTKVRSR